MSPKLMKFVRPVHKWLSLIVGLQMLLWLISALYFNTMDPGKAAGNTYRGKIVQDVAIEPLRLLEPQQILAKAKASRALKVVQLLGQPYYLLTHESGLYRHFKASYSLINAYNGEPTTIDKIMARKLAAQSYSGPGAVVSVSRLSPPIADFPKQQNPLWRVNYDDGINTSVYLNAETGRIIGHSDDDKRLAGLFFKLHFMDYSNQGSFNNWLIIFFAIATLWLVLSGIIWIVELANKGRYRPRFIKKKV